MSAQQVLGLPYDQFRTRLATMSAAEALPLLREQREYYAIELADIRAYQKARLKGETADARSQAIPTSWSPRSVRQRRHGAGWR